MENPKTEALCRKYADMDCEAVAWAVNALTVSSVPRCVFGSFRTLAALLTSEEYDTLRATLAAVAASERATGGYLLNDMLAMLALPGNEDGHGGGIDLGSTAVSEMLVRLCSSPNLIDVPQKIAAYVAQYQPSANRRFFEIHAGDVAAWRAEQ